MPSLAQYAKVDCGRSNGYRTRLWKHQRQHAFCDHFGMRVCVSHYPPGSSKWNPIEHRMFSFIGKNWAARPLRDYDTVLNHIRASKISSGLRVCARLNTKDYPKGTKISDQQMQQINLRHHTARPKWNYSTSPS